MLFQLHWQDRVNYTRTEFVAQASADTADEVAVLHEQFCAIIERRRGECPDGWVPMVCNEDSEYFERAVHDKPK